ncbi:hypothetical protein IGI04_002583 [Brassica rapa subsp. trilocularis]|uniref:Uncharacterized protein n=1 Tax=Brassica rapa subsp. trilocularis TaxID=1813537 RepID=A0ABQ7NWR0_BRACM|nr:hypothetical protein IGI04_002583 [Brassica rapa subsp. trilocularis]
MHFMLEDFPRSLQKVFQNLLSKTDFERLLRRLSEYFSEDFLGSLLMHFMLEDFPGSLPKSSGSLPKSSTQNLSQSLKDFSEDSEDFLESFLMYFMRKDFPQIFQEVFRSFLPKGVQRDDVKCGVQAYLC